jgi:hypothetical protein
MGINVLLSSSALGSDASLRTSRTSPNPNPYRYRIMDVAIINGFLLLDVLYPDATNYEGRKTLLFDRGVSLDSLKAQGAIDPHFCETGIHPIARFEPTPRGWEMARSLCNYFS